MSRRLASRRSEPYYWVNAPPPVVRLPAHVVVHLVPQRAPALDWPFAPVLRHEPDGAVERDPAHHLRMGELSARAAHLPDPLVGLAPDALEALEQAPAERPGVVRRRQPRRARLVERVQDLPVDVELELSCGLVAGPDGPRPLVALEPGELELGEPPLARDPVQRLRPVGRARDRAQEPVAPGARLVVVAGSHQGEQRHRRVPHPAEAVVPVADAAEASGSDVVGAATIPPVGA